MIGLGPSDRFYVYRELADLRKGLERLVRSGSVGNEAGSVVGWRLFVDHSPSYAYQHPPFGAGRKNYLHAGLHEAAQRAAIIYSLLSTCECHGIDPQAWLEDVLKRMPMHTTAIGNLLPRPWTKCDRAPTSQIQLPPVCASA